MKLIPIISALVNEGLNLQKKPAVDTQAIINAGDNWTDGEIKLIVSIAKKFQASFFDNFSTGGGCEVMTLRLPNKKVIGFTNITDNICVSSKTYDDPNEYYDDFGTDNSDELTCQHSIFDISDKSTQTIIQELSNLI